MLHFQDMLLSIIKFWTDKGFILHQGYDLEMGAGTLNPATFLRSLGPEPYNTVYVEPSRRPGDGRYGHNPNRLQSYFQMQVISKPCHNNMQELYIESLKSIGIDLSKNDIRFVCDDWENPTIGAWGLGWEIWLNGMEVSQFTYFQAVGSIPCYETTCEITYGLERLAMYLQGVSSIFDLQWNATLKYGDVANQAENEWSQYNFQHADIDMWLYIFNSSLKEIQNCLSNKLALPAYDFVIKASHAFNILDSRGLISVTERTSYISKIRASAQEVATLYIESREKLGFPLIKETNNEDCVASKNISINYDLIPEKSTFVFEIGFEELPHDFANSAINQLETAINSMLKNLFIEFDKLSVFGTYRRCAILIEGMNKATNLKQIVKKGPSAAALFKNGSVSDTAKGFLSSIGVSTDNIDLNILITNQEMSHDNVSLYIELIKDIPYVFAKITPKQEFACEAIKSNLIKILNNLNFPKNMRWNSSKTSFGRPIRWLMSLLENQIVNISYAGLTSSNMSFGHKQLNNKAIVITNASEYEKILLENNVIINHNTRKENIESQLQKIEIENNYIIGEQSLLIPQVLFLSEWPLAAIGKIDGEFKDVIQDKLIQKVFTAEMTAHQKYFPIFDQDNQLQPYFVIICDNTPNEYIISGNEKALKARLNDGLFLVKEDLLITSDTRNEQLAKVVFHTGLGSILNKTERLVAYVTFLNNYLKLSISKDIELAAIYCKSDLVSNIVKEFPILQSFAGAYFLEKEDFSSNVFNSIQEHTKPNFEADSCPSTLHGALLAIADKLDNIFSCFYIGLKPTSSADPYALRRQSFGILKILLEYKIDIDLDVLYDSLAEIFILHIQKNSVSHKNKKLEKNEILEFLMNRYRYVLKEKDFSKNEIEAVLNNTSALFNPHELFLKMQALKNLKIQNSESLNNLYEIFNRANKLLKNKTIDKNISINKSIFSTPEEEELFVSLEELSIKIEKALSDKTENPYPLILLALTKIISPSNMFFNNVKIFCDDEDCKNNRIALINKLKTLLLSVINFEVLQ